MTNLLIYKYKNNKFILLVEVLLIFEPFKIIFFTIFVEYYNKIN